MYDYTNPINETGVIFKSSEIDYTLKTKTTGRIFSTIQDTKYGTSFPLPIDTVIVCDDKSQTVAGEKVKMIIQSYESI